MSKPDHKSQILELRSQGLSYKEIQNQLGCSKSTISYHLGEGQKEKSNKRLQETRSKKSVLQTKIERFIYTRYEPIKEKEFKTPIHKRVSFTNPLRNKIKWYCRRGADQTDTTVKFTPEQLIAKTGDICYLTGKKLDLTNSDSYQLDHRIARSKGGLSTLENCELACSEVNYAKGNLSLDEFFQLCLAVVKHNNLI